MLPILGGCLGRTEGLSVGPYGEENYVLFVSESLFEIYMKQEICRFVSKI